MTRTPPLLDHRLAPFEIGWIAAHGQDRVLGVDPVLLLLYRRFAALHRFETVIVFRFSGEPLDAAAAGDAAAPDDDDAMRKSLSDAALAAYGYPDRGDDDAVAMCCTSATTDRPKGVVYGHRSTVLHAPAAERLGAASARDAVLPGTPMFHANSWGVSDGAAMLGAKRVFPGLHLHPEDLLDLMKLESPTFTLGVPTLSLSTIPRVDLRIVAEPRELPPWDGEQAGNPGRRPLRHRRPPCNADRSGESHRRRLAAHRRRRCGRPARQPAACRRRQGPDHVRGEWISSVDREHALMSHLAAAVAAVRVVPHPRWSDRPLACVVLRPGAQADAPALREPIAPAFAKWPLPDVIEFVDPMPRTCTGRVWKARLRERDADDRLPDGPSAPI